MFCGKCGTQNPEGAAFCQKCGAPLDGSAAPAAGSAPAAAAANRNRMVGIIAVAVAAAAVLFLVFTLFGGRSYKATVTKFLDATFDADAKAIVKLIPKQMVEDALESYGVDPDDMDKALDELSDQLKNQMDRFGDDLEVKYAVIDADDLNSRELSELKQDYSIYDVKISGAKNVEVSLKIDFQGHGLDHSISVPVVKVGGSWYLDALGLNRISLF